MSQYIATIGLEIHTHLKTRTKMFCNCLNYFDNLEANANICPVCLGHPGTLPVINKKAVEAVLKLGASLKGDLFAPSGSSKFDRKNYFYPDLPKSYQISQYDQPLVNGGALELKLEGEKFKVNLRRIHLEEDAARLVHSPDNKSSFVDFNRAGVPLMELVTEPDIQNGKQAVEFAKELQLILRYLDISDADMEKGQMRVEANISISKSRELGVKVEVKNLNSFRAVEEAIDYEIKRQEESLEKGDKIIQETRGWNDAKKMTVSQRTKEEAHDYRYFPEPDLPPLDISAFDAEKLKNELPELPKEKRQRFIREYNLSENQSNLLAQEKEMSDYFEEAASEYKTFSPDAGDYQFLYNYLTTNLRGLMKEAGEVFEEIKVNPEKLAHLIFLVSSGKITANMTKDILKEMFNSGEDPEDIIKTKGFHEAVSEDALEKAISEVIAENTKAVSDYKNGNENSLQFLIGQAMKKMKGKGNPEKIRESLEKKIRFT